MQTANRAQRRAAARAKPGRPQSRVNPAAALNPILYSTPLTPQENVVMKLRMREAFESIRTGEGDRDDFDHMVISYNAWMVLAEAISPEICKAMLPAGLAMMRTKQRVLDGKALRWDGQGIESLKDFMDIYDEIIDNVSPRQVQEAILEGHKRQTGKTLRWKAP